MNFVVSVGLMLVLPAGQAANSSYICPQGQELKGQFTPHQVRLTLSQGPTGSQEAQKWVLQRLRQAGQARYRRGQVVLTVSRSQAELTLAKGAAPLVCKLKVADFGARPAGY